MLGVDEHPLVAQPHDRPVRLGQADRSPPRVSGSPPSASCQSKRSTASPPKKLRWRPAARPAPQTTARAVTSRASSRGQSTSMPAPASRVAAPPAAPPARRRRATGRPARPRAAGAPAAPRPARPGAGPASCRLRARGPKRVGVVHSSSASATSAGRPGCAPAPPRARLGRRPGGSSSRSDDPQLAGGPPGASCAHSGSAGSLLGRSRPRGPGRPPSGRAGRARHAVGHRVEEPAHQRQRRGHALGPASRPVGAVRAESGIAATSSFKPLEVGRVERPDAPGVETAGGDAGQEPPAGDELQREVR